jgi:3-hydroxyacyl-CoA dehydrogenase
VLGLGTLGVTVAQLVVDHGDRAVAVVRPGSDKVARGRAAIERSLSREVKAARLDAENAADALARVHVTDDLGALADCDIVIECLPEVLADKQAALARVEPHLTPGAVFASSTSSLPAAAIAANASRPGRVAVTHYVWPANRTRLVEVAFPDGVDADVPDRVLDLVHAQQKQPLVVRDVAGFLITRAVMAYWNETIEVLAEGVGPDTIDAELEAMGWQMGPCRLLDGASLQSVATVSRAVAHVMGQRVAALTRLDPLVRAGYCGVSTGAGLYVHGPDGRTPNEASLALLRDGSREGALAAEGFVDRILGALVDEVERCVTEGVVSSWEDAALGIDLAYGFPGGVIAYAPPATRRSR